jgi:hypothetical protein
MSKFGCKSLRIKSLVFSILINYARGLLKSQVVVCKPSQKILCTSFCNGKQHDFKLFKTSNVRWVREIYGIADSGYLGIRCLQNTSLVPKKRSKKTPLTKGEKQENRRISALRVLNENVIGKIKRFKILSDRYRNRRKRFGLRFNLIAAIYNLELEEKQSKRLQQKESGSWIMRN